MVASLLLCCLLRPAHAQFLMPRSFISGTSPLDGAQAKLIAGANPLSLFGSPGKAVLGLTPRTANGFFVGVSAGQTVRVVKGGVLTTNFAGSGQTVYATVVSKRNTLRGDFFYQAGRQNALSAQPESNRRTDAHLTTSETAFRVTASLPRSWAGFAGISTSRATISSQSTALLHLLPLFGDTTPGAQIETGISETVAGLCCTRSRVFLFGGAGRFDAPGKGRILSHDPQTEVFLPLSAAGSLWSVGGQVEFGSRRRGQFAAFLSNKSARGTGSVTETSLGQETVLGEGHTHQSAQAGSLAVSWQADKSRVSLLYSRTEGQFDTSGGGLLAQPLGFSSDTVNRVGYFARAHVTREETGVGWESVGREQNVAVSCQYVRFPVKAAYGYSGRLFLLSYGQGEAYSEPSARGFALRARYEVPLSWGKWDNSKKRPRLVLGADQIIPLPLVRRKSENPTPITPPAPTAPVRTRTQGGWSVSAGVAYPF